MSHVPLARSRIVTAIDETFVHGAVELVQGPRGLHPQRLPGWARGQIHDPDTAHVVSCPSGVRVSLRTQSTSVHLVVRPTDLRAREDPLRSVPMYDIHLDGALLTQRVASPAEHSSAASGESTEPWRVSVDDLPGTDQHLEIWLPYQEPTELIEIHSDAPVRPAPPSGPRWVHHGSSISHGFNSIGASHAWPAVAARSRGLDLLNLGLAGHAMLDQFTARSIRDLPADIISLKLGINVVNADTFRLRSFSPAVHGFLDTVRDGHPETPLLLITPIWCGIHEHTPGPALSTDHTAEDGTVRRIFSATGDPADVAAGRLTLSVVRAELERIVAQRQSTDPALRLIDGLSLYGAADAAALPLPDDLHPDTATHQLIGERFATQAFPGGTT